jgi:hypothetical protein
MKLKLFQYKITKMKLNSLLISFGRHIYFKWNSIKCMKNLVWAEFDANMINKDVRRIARGVSQSGEKRQLSIFQFVFCQVFN